MILLVKLKWNQKCWITAARFIFTRNSSYCCSAS